MDEETQNIMEAGFGTLADLIRETNTGLAHLGARVDHLGTRIDRVRTDLGKRIAQTNGRLDNLIIIAGDQTRGLREDVDDLKVRMDALERKAS